MNELAELAGMAGPTITSLMVTDAWAALRTGLIGLWQRVMPGQAETITTDLDTLRTSVAAAHAGGDQGVTQAAQQNLQQRIAWLLMQDPTVAGELRQLLAAPHQGAVTGHVEQHVTHSGTGDSYVAGGSITVNR